MAVMAAGGGKAKGRGAVGVAAGGDLCQAKGGIPTGAGGPSAGQVRLKWSQSQNIYCKRKDSCLESCMELLQIWHSNLDFKHKKLKIANVYVYISKGPNGRNHMYKKGTVHFLNMQSVNGHKTFVMS